MKDKKDYNKFKVKEIDVYTLMTGELHTIDFDDDKVLKISESISKTADNILNGSFSKKISGVWDNCEFKFICNYNFSN